MTPQLADFEGRWQLERHIDDRLSGRNGQLTGEATFTADTNGLIYHESGLLRFPGQPPLSAQQSYLWREGEQGIEIRFSDGRPFHGFTPGVRDSAHHDCPPDCYEVQYDFDVWPEWSATWQVTGPHKDYTSTTRYLRT